MIHAANYLNRFLKQVLSISLLILFPLLASGFSFGLTDSKPTITQTGTACLGNIVQYTCSPMPTYFCEVNFYVDPSAGRVLELDGKKNSFDPETKALHFFVEWNENYTGTSSEIVFSYNRRIEKEYLTYMLSYFFKSNPIKFNVTFTPKLVASSDVEVIGNECVNLGSPSKFSLSGSLSNYENISFFRDGIWCGFADDTKSLNITFDDASRASSVVTAQVFDLCGNLAQTYTKVVKILPASIDRIKGGRFACTGSTLRYRVMGSQNATSFSWDCPDATVISQDGGINRDVKILFPTAKDYTITVTPKNDGCIEVVPSFPSFKVVVENDITNTANVEYDHQKLFDKLSSALTINTCSERSSECPVTLKNFRLYAKLDLGDEYKYGNNPFETKVELELRVNRLNKSPQIIPVTLTINPSSPEKLYVSNVFDSQSQGDDISNLRTVDVVIKFYKADAKVQKDIRLLVKFTKETQTEVSDVLLNMLAPLTNANSNEVTFKWSLDGTCSNVGNYQIQVMRLYKAGTPTEQEWKDALNLFTESSKKEIKILLAEGSGNYICRVRAVGNLDDETYQKGSCSAWGGGVSTFNFVQFEEDKNWIYSRTLTEGNKVSEKMQYANGLGSAIQQQVRLHDDNKLGDDLIVASQTVQDFSGRDALKTLPVPVGGKKEFSYVDNLISSGGNDYTAAQFDTDDKIYAPDDALEVGEYYSGNNNGVIGKGNNAGVPSAEGVPYSRTLFANDASGKVKEQASAGLTASLNSEGGGKTIKTFYTAASEDELIRLFGDEAPKAQDVHKVITVDPNNTATISYIDKNGKTIATALSVGTNLSLQELASAQNAKQNYTEKITEKLPKNPFSSSSLKNLIFTAPTAVTVNYTLNTNTIADQCSNNVSSCDYKVEFWLHDEDLGTSTHIESSDIVIPGGIVSQIQTRSFVLQLEAARKYVLEKRITTHTADAQGKLYLDAQLADLKDYYSNVLGIDKESSNSILKDIQAELTKVKPDPALVYQKLVENNCQKVTIEGQEYYKLDISCDGSGSLTINIPIYEDECKVVEKVYSKGCFLTYFQEATSPESSEVDGKLVFAPKYTAAEFNDLMDNLYHETEYFFADLWDTWVQQIQLYKSMNAMSARSDAATILSLKDEKDNLREMPKFDLLPAFYNAYINTKQQLRTTAPLVQGIAVEDFYTTDEPSTDEFLHAYKYFKYKPATSSTSDPAYACMHNGCNWVEPLPPVSSEAIPCGADVTYTDELLHTKFRALPAENRMRIASCVKSIDASQSNPDEEAERLMFKKITIICKSDCDARFDEFRNSIEDNIHNNGELIEGDNFKLVSVNMPNAGVSYKPWGEPIDFTLNPAMVSKCEVNRLTQAVVENCHNNCKISINGEELKDPAKSPFKLLEIQQVVSGRYDLNVSTAINACAANYTNVKVKIPTDGGTASDEYISDPGMLLCCDDANAWTAEDGIFTLGAGSVIASADSYDPYHTIRNKLKTALVPGILYRLKYTINSETSCGSGNWLNHRISFRKSDTENEDEIKPVKFSQYNNDVLVNYGEAYDNQVANIFEVNTLQHSTNEELEFIALEPSQYLTFDMLLAGACNQGVFTISNVSLERVGPDCPVNHSVCFKWLEIRTGVPVIPEYTPEYINTYELKPCLTVSAEKILRSINNQKFDLLNAKLNDYTALYTNTCGLPQNLNENFDITYELGYHHFTLYYYDRAGNLLRTVPPAGVDQTFLRTSDMVTLKSLLNTDPTLPHHTLVTSYQYNSLGQLVRQHTPDANAQSPYDAKYYTDFIYDNKGRLRFSRSALQKANGTYSYTKYDALGRVIEVGESNYLLAKLNSERNNANFPQTGYEQTITVYSKSALESADAADHISFSQRYLRNRVSYTYTDTDGSLSTSNDRNYTWYSYDTHGNVEWMVVGMPGLDKKRIRYEYDLLSNKVTKVAYNERQKDQFFHKYEYDADNRILATYTSSDDMVYDCDARYEYYAHGPLKRTVVGEDKIQGIDYTYTIQGWLKGINHPSLTAASDPGKDGTSSNSTGTDAFGMALTYYTGDYENASGKLTSTDPYNPVPSVNLESNAARNLYNGNISAWATNTNTNIGLAYEGLTAEQYEYDELNRIVSSKLNTQVGNKWQGVNDFATAYQYDANGNILALTRNAHTKNGASQQMDNLSYNYIPNTNKLGFITDAIGDDVWKDLDVDSQTADNYTYDYNGNLISDRKEKIASIQWTVYGKIKKITKTDGTIISYTYNASGNRTSKTVTETSGNAVTTYYVVDAQGNIMATYTNESEKTAGNVVEELALTEQPIYGSDRLGMRNSHIPMLRQTNLQNGDVTVDQLDVTHGGELGNWGIPVVSETNAAKVDVSVKQATPGVNSTNGLVGQGNVLQTTSVEDSKGEALFSFVTYDALNGAPNVALMLDKEGNLMYGQVSLDRIAPLAFAKGKSAIVQDVVDANVYYIYSIGANAKLYRHKVNMAAQGNGTEAEPLGEVVETNQLPVPATDFLPAMALASIKNGSGTQQLLYLLNDNGNTPNNLDLAVYNVAEAIPQRTLLATLQGNTDKADISLAPDGRHLAVTVNKGLKSGALGYTANGSDVLVYITGTDYKTASLLSAGNSGTNTGVLSLDFAPDSRYVYYTSLSAAGGYQLMRRAVTGTLAENVSSVGRPSSVVRALNNKLYVSAMGENQLSEYTHNTSGQPVQRTIQLSSDYQLTGVLPSQPHTALSGNGTLYVYARIPGLKSYELKDHLGNIRATISDRKLSDLSGSYLPQNFHPDLLTANNYYPFGMQQPGRVYNSGKYRFGYNGKEMDNDITGKTGSVYDYGFRIYNPGIAKFLSVDPLTKDYPWYTPYQFAGNMPIEAIDLDGLEPFSFKASKLFSPGSIISRDLNAKAFKAPFYNIPLAKEFVNRYSFGNGNEYTLSKKEMVALNVGKTGLVYGGNQEQRDCYRETILGLKKGESISISWPLAAQAFTSGTLANFTIKLEGTITRTGEGRGDWKFSGKMQFQDVYDFDPKPDNSGRSWWGEVQTRFANDYLIGTPFKTNSEWVKVEQTGYDKFLNYFNDKKVEEKNNEVSKEIYPELKTKKEISGVVEK